MIENSVLSAIEQFSLLDASKNITVALSGGADSVALLYALYRLREKLGITLSAAHLNHMIRGEEALRDEEFVKKLCKKYEIPLFCERADVPAFAKIQGLSLETAAREVRYGFLERVNCGVIAILKRCFLIFRAALRLKGFAVYRRNAVYLYVP